MLCVGLKEKLQKHLWKGKKKITIHMLQIKNEILELNILKMKM